MTHQRNYRTGRIIVKISLLSAAAGTISHPLDTPPPLTCAEYQQCFDPHLFSSATASLASLVSSFIAHSINQSISSIGSFCALPMRYLSCSSNLSHIVYTSGSSVLSMCWWRTLCSCSKSRSSQPQTSSSLRARSNSTSK